MEPETVSMRATASTAEAGDPAVRRRRIAVAGVSLMGAAAVSTAVFQTVTGTSTSLAMPDLASVLAGTASFPTPQGPAASAVPGSAPAITDLGVPTSTAADPAAPQVDLRANRGPLPDPTTRPAPAASPLAGVAPAGRSTDGAPSGEGSSGNGPARPRSGDGRDHGGGRHGGRGGSSGPTRPGSAPGTTTPGTTTPGTTPPTSTTPGTTTPRSTTPAPPSTSPPGSTRPSQPSTQAPPPSSAPSSSD